MFLLTFFIICYMCQFLENVRHGQGHRRVNISVGGGDAAVLNTFSAKKWSGGWGAIKKLIFSKKVGANNIYFRYSL